MRARTLFPPAPSEHAIERLREGRPGESGYGRRVVLLLTIPTFDDPVARDVRRTAEGEIYVVRTVWQRALDRTAGPAQASVPLSDPMLAGLPGILERRVSLRSSRVPVEPAAMEQLLESLASVAVPCQPSQSEPPLDATIYELTVGHGLSEMRYRWATAPGAWAPLVDFTTRLLRLVDEPVTAGSR